MSRGTVAIVAAILAAPATTSAATFSVKNDRGIAQYSFWQIEGERSWFSTNGFGRVEIPVEPGDVVRFTRTFAGPRKFPPPEGYRGKRYRVPDPVPSEVKITLPHTGPIYRPRLSRAERWVIRKANERRKERGREPLRISKTLTAAADSMARKSVREDRWPPSFLTAYQQDFGWPGSSGGVLDSPGKDRRKAIAHWTDGSVRERLLLDPDRNAIGVGEGGGWFIAMLSTCPTGPAATRCRLAE